MLRGSVYAAWCTRFGIRGVVRGLVYAAWYAVWYTRHGTQFGIRGMVRGLIRGLVYAAWYAVWYATRRGVLRDVVHCNTTWYAARNSQTITDERALRYKTNSAVWWEELTDRFRSFSVIASIWDAMFLNLIQKS